jgi:hypothetical protein
MKKLETKTKRVLRNQKRYQCKYNIKTLILQLTSQKVQALLQVNLLKKFYLLGATCQYKSTNKKRFLFAVVL